MEYLRWILIIAGAALLIWAVLLGRRRVDESVAVRQRSQQAERDLEGISVPLTNQAKQPKAKLNDVGSDFLPDSEIDEVLPKVAYDAEPSGVEVELDISDDFDAGDLADIAEKPESRKPFKKSVKSLANAVRKAQSSISDDLTPYSENGGDNTVQEPVEEKIVTLHVTAGSDRKFRGRDLQTAFENRGFMFGEMDIYHYPFEGERIFSVANMVKPGTFDPEKMAEFETPGIAMFMRLPVSLEPSVAFELLFREAQELADEIGGQVRDSNRNTMTRQTEQHMRDEIQQYSFRQKHAAPA
jgi:cell division protein ZipA